MHWWKQYSWEKKQEQIRPIDIHKREKLKDNQNTGRSHKFIRKHRLGKKARNRSLAKPIQTHDRERTQKRQKHKSVAPAHSGRRSGNHPLTRRPGTEAQHYQFRPVTGRELKNNKITSRSHKLFPDEDPENNRQEDIGEPLRSQPRQSWIL